LSDIEAIKSKLDIVDVIGSYIEVKKAGVNYKALCPFHSEKTPSFTINPGLQIFKCFGCGKGGDAIKFIQEIERIDFREALKIAAEKAGIELETYHSAKDKVLEEKKERIFKANELAAKFYNYILKTHKTGKAGRDYAQKRLIASKEIEKFMFGYAPGGKENLKNFMISKGFDIKELIEFGLLVERNGTSIDKFRNRLLQPISDLKGNIIGFSGRYIGSNENAPKYLNSSDSLVYKKNEILYGLYQAAESIRKEKFVIIVEGNIDIVSSSRVGVENIVAPLGTAFTENQAKLIKKFTDTIYFCFDKDKAGINAIIKSIKTLEDLEISHRVIDLLDYKDCDELITRNPDLWLEQIKNNKNTIDYLKVELAKDLDIGSAEGKKEYKKRIIQVLRLLKDEVQVNHTVKEISIMIDLAPETLLNEIYNNKDRRVNMALREEESAEYKENDYKVPENKFNLNKYLLALIIQSNIYPDSINQSIFKEDNNLYQLAELIFKAKDSIDNLIDTLAEELKALYSELLIWDLSKIIDMQKEINDAYVRVSHSLLKQEILALRKELAKNEDNIEIITQLSELTKKLKSIKQHL
jgi:DNA primase